MPSFIGKGYAIETVVEAGLLKKKAVKGVLFLGLRRVFMQLIQTGSGIILARLLFPEIFGAFAIAFIFVNLFSIFAVIPFGMAIVQRKKEPSKEEIQASFTFNLLLGLVMTFLVMILAPIFYGFYPEQLGDKGVFYLRILSVSLLALGLKSISLIKLQRELDYRKIVIGETLEIFVTQAVCVFLAIRGWGILSLIFGTVVGRYFGSLIFFILSPWPIGFNFSLKSIKEILPFGFNFQISNVIGVINGAITPILVGKVIGSSAVGLISWAGGLAAFPRAASEILSQMVFPVCSRSQEDKRLLGQIIEKSIQLSCLCSFPLTAILLALAKPVTYLIYTDKWLIGLPVLYIFLIQSVFIVLTDVFMQSLLALGESKKYRNISFFWSVLQWALAVPLVLKLGFVGLPIAGLIVSSTFFIPLAFLRQKVKFALTSHVIPYIVFSAVAGGVAFLANNYHPSKGLFDLIWTSTLGLIAYSALLYFFKREEIIDDILKVKKYCLNDLSFLNIKRP